MAIVHFVLKLQKSQKQIGQEEKLLAQGVGGKQLARVNDIRTQCQPPEECTVTC